MTFTFLNSRPAGRWNHSALERRTLCRERRHRHRREPSIIEIHVTHRELQISPIQLMISTIHLVIPVSPILGIVDITN